MQPGQKVGPFDIEKRIGSGAMGTVYRARYRKTGQRVAIKIISPGVLDNETILARFERESEVLKQLHHPNIVRFYAASQHQGIPYYAMEFIEGEPLDVVLQRRGRLTWEQTVEFGQQVCAALQHAHSQGIVHRDLKPSNLMVTADGAVKLTDFGIAKDLDVTQLTAANATVGTAAYMSPEQCRGERNLSHKSDLYSMGIMLYELLTGQKPFKAETTMDMFLQHVQGTFERPARIVTEIPMWLDTVVCQLLEKKPEHRPYDAAMVSKALSEVAEKVSALQSAGVDAAKARFVDRSRQGTPSAQDKADARMVLASLRGGRRKRKKPFYEKVWFQALGILLLLGAMGGLLHEVFKPPSALALYNQAKAKMDSPNFDERAEARDGPVEKFLHYYGTRTDAQAMEIKDFAAKIDVTRKWNGLQHRWKLGADDLEEKARDAYRQEEAGELDKAVEHWQAIINDQKTPDEYGLKSLAEQCIADKKAADKKEQAFSQEMEGADHNEREFKPANDFEKLANDAWLAESVKDYALARSHWTELKLKCGKDWDNHTWWLISCHRMHDLQPKLPKDEEQKLAQRQKIVEGLLREADKTLKDSGRVTARDSARYQYQKIVALYDKESDETISGLVNHARTNLRLIPNPSSSGKSK